MSGSSSKSLRVLLAEDSVVNQRLARALLEGLGHTVRIAVTGRQVLELMQSDRFDLILMDIHMPELDGLEATRQIRTAERGGDWHMPIIAMTAQAAAEDRDKCLDAGTDDYIAKPIRAQELAEKISQVLARAGGSEPSAMVTEPVSEAKDLPPAVAIDWDTALKAVGGKRQLMRELIDLFCEEGPRLLQEAWQAIENRNAETLRIAAHTLKGSSRYFGPNQIGDVAGELEAMAARDDLAAAPSCHARLASALDQLLPLLRAFET